MNYDTNDASLALLGAYPLNISSEHHSLDIRLLAAVFTLLTVTKKAKKKETLKKLNPNSQRTGRQKV